MSTDLGCSCTSYFKALPLDQREVALRASRTFSRSWPYQGTGDVAMVGEEAELRAQLGRLRDAGVTDFTAAPFPAEEGAAERTVEFLAGEI